MKSIILSTLLLPLCWIVGFGQNSRPSIVPKKYFTQKVQKEAPVLDGRIEDACWQNVDWGGDFIQYQPDDGKPPSQQTSFKILYDAKFLYVGFRCHDTDPDKIVKRMSRRDGFEGDFIEINIDSYHDLKTAFSFTISASGVKGDEFISNDGNEWDESWNPIWDAKTAIDDQGWTAEMRIPLSQLRFAKAEAMVWGIQFTRRIFRDQERSVWQPISRNAGYWVSGFGELHGLEGIQPQKQIEIQPYGLAQLESFAEEAHNPFATGFDQRFSAGLDGKIGLTSDMILDFTINPDFGQVEADPSALVLDGFEIIFSERRPFFIESRNIFEYPVAGTGFGGPYDSDLLFYSRRIGGAPHASPDTEDHEFYESPQSTSILGAAKFSGKTKKGLSIGILESVTAEEMAEIDSHGERREEVVEPRTSYFVGRLQQDMDRGNTVLGGMFTATNRSLEDTGLDDLHQSAYSGGLDFARFWNNRSWQLNAKAVFSHLNGSVAAITDVQESFGHYFQRPDADHLKVDTSLTSLTGHGGTVRIGKYGGEWRFETGVTWRSPELELNDLGFLRNADEINYFNWVGYRRTRPFSIFRRFNANYNHWSRWDFGGRNLYRALNVNFFSQFKNFWAIGGGFNYENLDISNTALFGGPTLRRPNGIAQWLFVSSDERKKVSVSYNLFNAWAAEEAVRAEGHNFGVRLQPVNAFNITIESGYKHFARKFIYVTDASFNNETRYIGASLDQKTFSTAIRFNYSITPDLSIQYYGSPFVSRVRYSDYKFIVDPLGKKVADRHQLYSEQQISFNEKEEVFFVDDDLDGQPDYNFDQPDFTFVQFRSNLVARWEYIPGSELFLVWSQGMTDDIDAQGKLFGTLENRLALDKIHNIFLVKLTYRFLL